MLIFSSAFATLLLLFLPQAIGEEELSDSLWTQEQFQKQVILPRFMCALEHQPLKYRSLKELCAADEFSLLQVQPGELQVRKKVSQGPRKEFSKIQIPEFATALAIGSSSSSYTDAHAKSSISGITETLNHILDNTLKVLEEAAGPGLGIARAIAEQFATTAGNAEAVSLGKVNANHLGPDIIKRSSNKFVHKLSSTVKFLVALLIGALILAASVLCIVGSIVLVNRQSAREDGAASRNRRTPAASALPRSFLHFSGTPHKLSDDNT